MDDNGTTLQEIDAGANACSVEWCPVARLESYVACSTYLLTKEDSNASNNAATAPASTAAAIDDDAAAMKEAAKGAAKADNAGVGQTRTGTIVVHKLACNAPTSSPTQATGVGARTQAAHLKEEARASLDGGVLDAKWSQQPLDSSGAAVLAFATSTGRLVLYSLSAGSDGGEEEEEENKGDDGGCVEFQQLASSDAGDSLLLSLDWSGEVLADAKIVVSQSDGALAIWRPHPNGGATVREVAPWHAHTLRGGVPTEAWISFFKKPGPSREGKASLVVSGADDALMKGWDLRVGGGGGGGAGCASPAFVCKDHGAGVTAGQWHPTLEHTFASGSYDENVRVWDARALRRPVSTTATGGGLWRLKWHPNPERGNLLLAACMHAGMRVLDTGMSTNDPLVQDSLPCLDEGQREGVLAKYTRHASMAYGADWCRLPSLLHSERAVVASCSFYDSLLCLWQTPPLWTQ